MTAQNETNKLHDLIHGMSKSDKAYLKKYSKIFISAGETKHKIYYAIIERMLHYSSVTLKKNLENHGGFRRFKNTEQELYNQILEDLVILKSKKRPTWQYYIEHMKSGYLFLDNKFEESLKHYSSIEKLKDEANNATIDYLYYKYYYHNLTVVQNARKYDDVQVLKEAEENLRQSIENLRVEFLLEAAVMNFEHLCYCSYNKTISQFLKEMPAFEQAYVDVLPKNFQTKKLKTLCVYYQFQCMFASYTKNMPLFDEYSKKFHDSYKSEKLKYQYDQEYITALVNRVEYLALTKSTAAYDVISEFKEYISTSVFNEMKSYFHVMYCQTALLLYVQFNDRKSIYKFVEEEAKTYQANTKNVTYRFVLNTEMLWASAHFITGDFKAAQPHLDKIFTTLNKVKEVYNKVLVAARILDILIHFELKNYENIGYYIDNLENEMKRNNQLLAFDKGFLNQLRKLNQQLFSLQKPNPKEVNNYLISNKEENRIDSYTEFINFEAWTANFNT